MFFLWENIKKTRKILLIFNLFILLLLIGCNSNQTDETSEPTITKESTKSTEETLMPNITDKAAINPTVTPETVEEPNINEVTIMDDFFKDYTFDISEDKDSNEWERTYSVTGIYDLNGDGQEDSINLVLAPYSVEGSNPGESYIEVNGIKEAIEIIMPAGEVYVIDLDSQDKYNEIAIYDYGPSADDTLLFYRYDGKDVFFIGEIDRLALMDGKGKFISWLNVANQFAPQFYSGWEELKDNQFVSHTHNVEQYVGKDYDVSGSGYFIPLDTNPGEDYLNYVRFEPSDAIDFKGTKVKILDILGLTPDSRLLNWYYVEMDEGQKGLMYFWIGD